MITYTIVVTGDAGKIYLIDIYDKSEYSTIDTGKIREVISQLGLSETYID